jgi:hypothetical protein
MREALSSLYNANRYADVKDESTTLVWNSIKTEYGTLRFQMSRYIFAGALFFVNLPDIEIRPYKGGEWKDVQLSRQWSLQEGPIHGRLHDDLQEKLGACQGHQRLDHHHRLREPFVTG